MMKRDSTTAAAAAPSRRLVLARWWVAGVLVLGGGMAWLFSAKHWPREKDFTNGIGMEMVWCEAGTFLMGSPETETGRNDNETQHEVTLTSGFWIGRYEVTQREWTRVMGNNPSLDSADRLLWIVDVPRPRGPVEQVSWEQAMVFCLRLTKMEREAGRLKEGWAYSLPSEAQWEYACRAGTSGPYAGATLAEFGWYESNSGDRTHPVGRRSPNAWGIYDMHGNVWEWCLDGAPALPLQDYDEPRRLIYPIGRGAFLRVIRGGGFLDPPKFCRSASRHADRPKYRDGSQGFRVCLVPSSQPGKVESIQ